MRKHERKTLLAMQSLYRAKIKLDCIFINKGDSESRIEEI